MTVTPQDSSSAVTLENEAHAQSLRWQLLSTLGVTHYRLQQPELLNEEIAKSLDLPAIDVIAEQAVVSQNELQEKSVASDSSSAQSVESSKPRSIDNLRAILADKGEAQSADTSTETNQPIVAEPSQEINAQENHKTAPHSDVKHSEARPLNANALDVSGKWVVEANLYQQLPEWFWQDVLLLQDVSAEQVLPIDAEQHLSHTQEARFILRETAQTAFYASNFLGLDATLITQLAAQPKSEQHCQAKQQFWHMMRAVVAK